MPRSSSLSTVAPGGLALFAAFTWRYRYEKRRALHTLRLGSRVAETSAGAVEYAMRGEGLPLLALHGAGGGYEQGLAVGRCWIARLSRRLPSLGQDTAVRH